MHTQCPNCSTVFALTEEARDAHQGMVRCGRCREVFNASWNLVHTVADEEPVPSAPGESDSSRGEAPDVPEVAPSPTFGHEPESKPIPIPDGLPSVEEERLSPDEATTQTQPLINEGPGETVAPLTTEELDFLDNRLEVKARTESEGADEAPPVEIEPAVADVEDGATKRETAPVTASETVESKPSRLGPTEEIVIESPSGLWDPIDEEALAKGTAGKSDEKPKPQPTENSDGEEQGPGQVPASLSDGKIHSRAPQAQTVTGSMTTMNLAGDVRMVEIPYPQPIKTAAWALGVLFLVLGIIWQIREFYLPDLSRVPTLRGPLIHFCEYVSCSVPPRSDMKSIDLVSTSVDPHPVTPGALRVSAHLVNRARFAQSFPPLEVTLTDKEGNVVGRRTYMPHEYRGALDAKMTPNVIERADLDLAQPADSAVGYEIQLVAR